MPEFISAVTSQDRIRSAREVLLKEVASVSPHDLPGVDGMTIDDALRCYDALARGCVARCAQQVDSMPGLWRLGGQPAETRRLLSFDATDIGARVR